MLVLNFEMCHRVKQKCETRVVKLSLLQGESANLFHGNFYLLELRLPTEYRPRDVQTNKPDAIWPLNTHIKTQINTYDARTIIRVRSQQQNV